MRLIIWLAVLCASIAPDSSNAADLITYPDTSHSARSPNGHFSVSNKDRDDAPNHSLYLTGRNAINPIKIMDYSRHVDVSWSPDSTAFFVNDYAESNSALCKVISAHGLRETDIMGIIRRSAIKGIKNFDGSHLYVTCSAWKGAGKVSVVVHGYDGRAPNLDRSLLVDIVSGRTISR